MSSTVVESLSFSLGSLTSTLLDGVSHLGPMFRFEPVDYPSLNPNVTRSYTHEFGFERLFESHSYVNNIRSWLRLNWTYSFLFAALYMIFVYAGRMYMKDRPRFELRKPLIIWNVFLAVFSIVGYKILIELIKFEF